MKERVINWDKFEEEYKNIKFDGITNSKYKVDRNFMINLLQECGMCEIIANRIAYFIEYKFSQKYNRRCNIVYNSNDDEFDPLDTVYNFVFNEKCKTYMYCNDMAELMEMTKNLFKNKKYPYLVSMKRIKKAVRLAKNKNYNYISNLKIKELDNYNDQLG